MRFLWLLSLYLRCLSSWLCLARKYSSVCDASLELESESDDEWWYVSSDSSVDSGLDEEPDERLE